MKYSDVDIAWLKSVAHIGPKRQTDYPFDLANA
jgi:hypothetical protein